MKKRFLIFLYLLLYVNLFAQLNVDDSLSQYKPYEVISNWQTNYNAANNDEKKTLVLIQTGYAFRKIVDYPKSLFFLRKTEQEVKKVTDHYFKSLIYSRLALLFSTELHYFKALSLTKESFKESELISDNDDKYYAKAFAYYNLLIAEHSERNYLKAAALIPFCYDNFYKISTKNQNKHQRFLMYTYVNFGDTYMQVKQYEKAEKSLLKGLALGKGRFEPVEVTIYQNLMEIKINLKDFNTAIFYAQKALKMMRSQPYLNQKNSLYDGLIESYKNVKDVSNVKKYIKLKNENEKKILFQENSLISKNAALPSIPVKQKNSNLYIIFICLFISVIIIFFIKFYYKNKNENRAEEIEIIDLEKISKENKTLTVPLTLEKELLKKLEIFEQSKKFTNPKISIPILASMLGTNIQYLSIVINKNKGKNFNSYINHLRIQYIIKQLETNKTLKTYKISYLANMAGFVSHSTFSKIFKQETGVLPSEYIKGMQNFDNLINKDLNKIN